MADGHDEDQEYVVMDLVDDAVAPVRTLHSPPTGFSAPRGRGCSAKAVAQFRRAIGLGEG